MKTTKLLAESKDWPSSSNGVSRNGAKQPAETNGTTPRPTYATIAIAARALDDVENMRIRATNQLQALTSPLVEGEHGGSFGMGLPDFHPDVVAQRQHLDEITQLEKRAVKRLEVAVRDHPIGPWVQATKCLGLKTLGRLLGAIGNPADRPNVAKLWAYCGYHVIDGHAPKHEKGVQSNWNDEARKRCYVIAEGMVKNRTSAYRDVYENEREKAAAVTHGTPCVNRKKAPNSNGCGTKANPELGDIGTALRPGHQHARAMRRVAKEFLKDLWVEARQLQNASDNQSRDELS